MTSSHRHRPAARRPGVPGPGPGHPGAWCSWAPPPSADRIVGWISDVVGPRAGIAVGAVACLVAAAYGARTLDLAGDLQASRADAAVRTLELDTDAVALAD